MQQDNSYITYVWYIGLIKFLTDVNSLKFHKNAQKIYQTIIESNINNYVKKGNYYMRI